MMRVMKKTRDLKIILDGRKLSIPNVVNSGFYLKFKGLMFRREDRFQALLFSNSKNRGIHSFFVFFKFLCVWLDDKNKVVDYKIVNPFNLYVKSSANFSKILEIPLNNSYKKILTKFKY